MCLSEQRHRVTPNVEVYTSMIAACAKSGNPEEAERYFSLMKEGTLHCDLMRRMDKFETLLHDVNSQSGAKYLDLHGPRSSIHSFW